MVAKNVSPVGLGAVKKAANQSANGPTYGIDQCMLRTRECFGAPAIGDFDHNGRASAYDGWEFAKKKHPTSSFVGIPAGVPVWWKGGSHGDGHVAISAGNGKIWSTDILRTGRYDHVDGLLIQQKWGLTFLGWSEDINGVTVYTADEPKPVVVPKTRGVEVDAAIHALQLAKAANKATTRRGLLIRVAERALFRIPFLK